MASTRASAMCATSGCRSRRSALYQKAIVVSHDGAFGDALRHAVVRAAMAVRAGRHRARRSPASARRSPTIARRACSSGASTRSFPRSARSGRPTSCTWPRSRQVALGRGPGRARRRGRAGRRGARARRPRADRARSPRTASRSSPPTACRSAGPRCSPTGRRAVAELADLVDRDDARGERGQPVDRRPARRRDREARPRPDRVGAARSGPCSRAAAAGRRRADIRPGPALVPGRARRSTAAFREFAASSASRSRSSWRPWTTTRSSSSPSGG